MIQSTLTRKAAHRQTAFPICWWHLSILASSSWFAPLWGSEDFQRIAYYSLGSSLLVLFLGEERECFKRAGSKPFGLYHEPSMDIFPPSLFCFSYKTLVWEDYSLCSSKVKVMIIFLHVIILYSFFFRNVFSMLLAHLQAHVLAYSNSKGLWVLK